jgi:hypothetical protein
MTADSSPTPSVTPYVEVTAGQLITASLFNTVQTDIRSDIAGQIKQVLDEAKHQEVDLAADAKTLDGKTIADLEKELLDDILKKLPGLIGNYRRIFKRLEVCQEEVIKHDFKVMPLVDVYQLDYFLVVCARGEKPEDRAEAFVNFYLYNDGERTIRTQALDTKTNTVKSVVVDIELRDATPFRVKFSDMLDLYGVQYTETTTLDELENHFWNAFFDPQTLNDRFDSDQYCHSPWFEKCCGEQRSVADLKAHSDWDHIWLKWHARKTVNFPMTKATATAGTQADQPGTGVEPVGRAGGGGVVVTGPGAASCPNPGPAPTNIQVVHFDASQIGITLLEKPVYIPSPDPHGQPGAGPILNGQDNLGELKVMVLLKA